LFYVTGNVYPEVERKHPDYPLKTPRVIFRNLGNGKFEELSMKAAREFRPRTAAAGARSEISTTTAISISLS
jgi:hypothetical protein